MDPLFEDPQEGRDAIRAFAETCVRERTSAPQIEGPRGVVFETSLPNGGDVADDLRAAGWERVGDVEFAVELETWHESREPLAAAMNASFAPFAPYWLGGFANAEEAAAAEQERVAQLRMIFDAWAEEPHPQWYTEASDPLPAGVAQRLAANTG